MGAFLNGLMGSLKGLGGDLKKSSLFAAIDPALGSTPGGAARAPGTGGLTPAGDLSQSDLGDFKFGPGLSVEGVKPGDATAAAPAAKPGFFKRINTVDPATGMSTVDKWDRFGARLGDISDGGNRTADVETRAKSRLDQVQQIARAQQIDQMFPGEENAQMRFLLKSNPEAGTKALAEIYQAQHKPTTEKMDDRIAFVDPATQSVHYSDPRGPTHSEGTADQRLQHEVAQDDRVFNLDDWAKHDASKREWSAYQARKAAGGFGTPGVGSAGRVLGTSLPEGY